MAGGPRAEPLGGLGPLWQLALQYVRFGTVGMAATATHVLIFAASIELAGVRPLMANMIAFPIAVLVSFIGNFRWTFASGGRGAAGIGRPARVALVRFAIIALIGLALNSLAVYLVVDALALAYGLAIVLMVTVVPGIMFTLSKLWAFG